MFFEFLKMGKKIRIDGKRNYTPAEFDFHGGKIWVDSPALGYFPHDNFTSNPQAFENHVKNMVKEGFTVDIKSA